jgi:hypothetical protein
MENLLAFADKPMRAARFLGADLIGLIFQVPSATET